MSRFKHPHLLAYDPMRQSMSLMRALMCLGFEPELFCKQEVKYSSIRNSGALKPARAHH